MLSVGKYYYIVSLSLISFSGWLEEIGLPQYKDTFSEGSVDGRMLNYLTFVSNLILLSITTSHKVYLPPDLCIKWMMDCSVHQRSQYPISNSSKPVGLI